MRLPNGYGSVYKLSGKRRNPFIVRVTVGWTDEGKQLLKTIGYYASRPLAMQALAEYNQSPYDISASKSTFKDIYEQWSARKFEQISRSNALGYKTAFDSCITIHDKKFIDLRKSHLQRSD